MTDSSARLLPWIIAVFAGAFAVGGFVELFGGPRVLGDARSAIFGAGLTGWFGWQLRRESGRVIRRVLWCGLVAGAVLLFVGILELAGVAEASGHPGA